MLEKFIPEKFHRSIYIFKKSLLGFAQKSYAQEGEDMVLQRKFHGQQSGFYIDIGAHHPHRFSNTHLFYKKGWSGINIDAMPSSMDLFNKYRKRDINLELAISDVSQTLTYYAFVEPAINGFDPVLSQQRVKAGEKLLFTKEIKTLTLQEIFEKYLPTQQAIDFMSVDVEGIDLQILKSNNWTKYRPKVVLAECLSKNVLEVMQEDVYKYMIEQDYSFIAKTINTCFFEDNKMKS